MKKTIKKILCTILALTVMLCVTGCGENAKKQEAVDTFEKTRTSFNEVGALINDNADAIQPEVIQAFQTMSEQLNRCSDLLKSDQELPDEKYDEIIANLQAIDDWLVDAKSLVEDQIAGIYE